MTAMAHACRLDMTAAAWLPSHCLDDELAEEFDHSGHNFDGTWTYCAHVDKNTTYPTEELGLLPESGGVFCATHE